MSFLDHIAVCSAWPAGRFKPFLVAGRRFGWLTREFAALLADFGPPFVVVAEGAIAFDPALSNAAERSAAFDGALDRLAKLHGKGLRRRRELYPVVRRWGEEPVMLMDRGAVPYFGVRSFGLHVNGFVRSGEEIALWVGKRAENKPVAPGKLDHMVAGGQPHGLSLRENLIKEAAEEASLPAEVAARARPVGVISYLTFWEEQIRDDVLFVYDLELPKGLEPRPSDGEMQFFELWPLAKAMQRVETTRDFKFNVNLVLIDFFIRHGFLDPERPDYLSIIAGLHQNLD